MKSSRRRFLVQAAGLAAAHTLMSASLPAGNKKKKDSLFKEGSVVLFQGDSITDAGRDRKVQKANDAGSFGHGYAMLTAASLLAKMPEMGLTVHNRGISGNKVFQLAERWQEDCLDLKPDILSILIGVNDYWHKRNGNYDGTVEIYERDLRTLLKRTLDNLPGVTLVICEPFSIDGGTAIGEGWQEEFEPYRKAAKALSVEFDTLFIPYHAIFKNALKHAPAAYWGPDGVHPSMAGAQLMANAWLEAVKMF